MESVTPDPIFFIKGIRQGIHERIIRHCLMKRCIKYTNLRHIGKYRFHSINTFKIGRIMKRSKVGAIFNPFNCNIIEITTFLKKFSTMDKTMTNGIYFIQVFYHSPFFTYHKTEQIFNAGLMIEYLSLQLYLITVESFIFKERSL